MLQKIIKVGNSAAVTIPKEYFDQLKLRVGANVVVNLDQEEKIIKIDPKPTAVKKKSYSVTPEFTQWADNFIEENKELLKKLARK